MDLTLILETLLIQESREIQPDLKRNLVKLCQKTKKLINLFPIALLCM